MSGQITPRKPLFPSVEFVCDVGLLFLGAMIAALVGALVLGLYWGHVDEMAKVKVWEKCQDQRTVVVAQ